MHSRYENFLITLDAVADFKLAVFRQGTANRHRL